MLMTEVEADYWRLRKTIALKFNDLARFIYVEPGKGYSAKIISQKRDDNPMANAYK